MSAYDWKAGYEGLLPLSFYIVRKPNEVPHQVKKKFEWKKKKTKKNTIRQKSDDKKPSIQSFKKFKKKKIHKARLRCAKKQARPSFPALLLPCYDVIHSLCVLPSPWFSHFNYQQYLMASCLQGSLKETITFIDILLLFSSSSPSLDIMQKWEKKKYIIYI